MGGICECEASIINMYITLLMRVRQDADEIDANHRCTIANHGSENMHTTQMTTFNCYFFRRRRIFAFTMAPWCWYQIITPSFMKQ